MNENIYYIYKHTFSNGMCYIGKGKNQRAYKLSDRNKYWTNNFNKYGNPNVEILFDKLYENEAFEIEINTISLYKNLNIKLCNITIGGEGVSGLKHSIESRKKMSINTSFRRPEMREKVRLALTGKPSHMKGKTHSIKTKEQISKNRKGKNIGLMHRNFGKKGIDNYNYGKSINKKIYHFYNNKEEQFVGTINEMIKKYNLGESAYKLISSDCRSVYHGWKIKETKYIKKEKAKMSDLHKINISKSKTGLISNKRDINIYNFINLDTNEEIKCTKFELSDKLKIDVNCITPILNGRRSSLFRWAEKTKIKKFERKCYICDATIYEDKICSDECRKKARANKATEKRNLLKELHS